MLIEILQAREYRVIGARVVGDEVQTSKEVGEQLVAQGFAREITKPHRVEGSKKVRSSGKEG